jgi:cyclophilin family peptidyl-prolyl cis-trans isomerase
VLAQLEEWYPEDLRVIFRHFPLLQIHDKASLAGQAAEAAGAQGSFWAMHDQLFARFIEWVTLSPDDFQEWLINVSSDLGLDMQQFRNDLENRRYLQTMQDAFLGSIASGIPGTPYIFFNGLLFRLEPNLTNLEASIRLELLAEQQHGTYPPMSLEDGMLYSAYLHMQSGDVVIQLYPDFAPLAVNSFVFLAHEGWFDGNLFHRVIPGILVESGDPSATGFGGPGYNFETEIDDALTFDEAGMVALTSSGPGANGSQFFITLTPLPELNNSRTIFGRVIQGLDLLQGLSGRQPIDDLLTPPEALIISVTIEVR